MKLIDLNQVKKIVISCTNCSLCKTRTRAVPGKGSHSASVMLVGEAPGRSEDMRGEPFVGAAGKKLDAALEEAEFSRDSLYITNVVKCRPPNNRKPTSGEEEACSEYLKAEIEMINPKVICILGNTAYWSLLKGTNISKHRGKVVKYKERLFFLTIHPAASIYNNDLFVYLKEDMSKLRRIITSLESGNKIKIDIENS